MFGAALTEAQRSSRLDKTKSRITFITTASAFNCVVELVIHPAIHIHLPHILMRYAPNLEVFADNGIDMLLRLICDIRHFHPETNEGAGWDGEAVSRPASTYDLIPRKPPDTLIQPLQPQAVPD